jgi:hypothetical protein
MEETALNERMVDVERVRRMESVWEAREAVGRAVREG